MSPADSYDVIPAYDPTLHGTRITGGTAALPGFSALHDPPDEA